MNKRLLVLFFGLIFFTVGIGLTIKGYGEHLPYPLMNVGKLFLYQVS
jgi:hypothetical protein